MRLRLSRWSGGRIVLLVNLLLCVMHLHVWLSGRRASSLSSRQLERLLLLARCMDNSSRALGVSEECRGPSAAVMDSLLGAGVGEKRVAEEQQLGDSSDRPLTRSAAVDADIARHKDCYVWPDMSSPRHSILDTLDRHDPLGSMRACGLQPELCSRRLVPRPPDDLPVPNIVHFVFFKSVAYDLSLRQYLAVRAAAQNLQPRFIFWFSSRKPKGSTWDKLTAEVANVYYVRWLPDWTLYGRTVNVRYAQSDIARLKIVHAHGGVYLDDDVFVLNSYAPLRRREQVTMSKEINLNLINCVIVSVPRAPFIRLWAEVYYTIHTLGKSAAVGLLDWKFQDMYFPNSLAKLYPHLIHVEDDTLAYPPWPKVHELYVGTFDWRNKYSLHITGHNKPRYKGLMPQTLEEMDRANNTVAAIMRHIYYSNITES